METHLNNMDVSSHANPVRGGSKYEEPQGELEQAIAQLWTDVFHIDKVGRNDNFFELGGNSLLALDLSELFATSLEIEVTALVIFQHPTVAAIAQLIESQ